MNARKLAVELAVLEKSQREQLLSELPSTKRGELQRLLRELQPMLAAPTSSFERVMADLRAKTSHGAEFNPSESLLTQLLEGETLAVKKQLVDVFTGGRQALVTAHVRSVLTAYLKSRAETISPVPRESALVKHGWARFWK